MLFIIFMQMINDLVVEEIEKEKLIGGTMTKQEKQTVIREIREGKIGVIL